MAAVLRPFHIVFWFFFCLLCHGVLALPFTPRSGYQPSLLPRGKFVFNNATGVPQIFNPATQQIVPQGPATDGGGQDFNIAAIIWLAFCFIIGPPMALAGIRCWRVTTGVGIGLSATVCSWAAIVNSVNNIGIPDAILSAIVIGFSFLGFILGLFEIGRVAGITTLGVTGGLAFGMRIILVRSGLLLPGLGLYPVNWILIALTGALGGAAMAWQKTQRAGILFGSASVGTFLTFLGIDLIVNRQSGMSRGLRFLFDRNNSHALDIIVGGYSPPLSTQIILGVSLALTPVLAYAQHRVFGQPFTRKPPSRSLMDVNSESSDEKDRQSQRQTFLTALWDGAKLKATNRFSV